MLTFAGVYISAAHLFIDAFMSFATWPTQFCNY